MLRKFISITLSGIMIFATALAVSAASSHGGSMSGMGASNPSTSSANTNPAADRTAFNALWKKTFAAGNFTPDQTAKLTKQLNETAGKLADNYTGLSALLEQKKMAKPGEAGTLDKRIDLKEGERDLIINQAKLALDDILNQTQSDLVVMAAFHGVSVSNSGADHLNSMHGGMGQGQQMNNVEQTTMDLGNLAERLNTDCKAVTLGLILEHLKTIK